jgi:hypothetical protein
MNATADLINKPGVLDTFFTVLGILVTGLAGGFTVVGVFIYKPPNEEDEEDEEEDLYENKYSEDFEELEEKELSDDFMKGLCNVYLTEETPEGNVVMCYDKETECFNYWCDDKNVNFLNLDAVAQKYAIDNECKALCVNYKLEVEKATQELNEKKEVVEEIEEEKDENPSIFAKFKSYNTVNKNVLSNNKQSDSVQVEKSNTFKYKGKIYEWENQSKSNEDKKSCSNDSLSLIDWLKKKKEDLKDESEQDSSSEENVQLETTDKVESKKEK